MRRTDLASGMTHFTQANQPPSRIVRLAWRAAALALLLLVGSGCTPWGQYVRNGFKVGPNHCPPGASVAENWIDATDLRTESNPEILQHWWTVFDDPKLNELVLCAYQQNLTLRQACFRILQARATRDIAAGNLFPQQQTASGSYLRSGRAMGDSVVPVPGLGNRFSDSWDHGFNLSWELDFWGRFRRAIASADANLDASVADYDDVLVTLLADVAANYVAMRTAQERIQLLQTNAKLQRDVLQFIDTRLQAGFRQTELDLDQATSTLRQTEAGIPQLEIARRQAENNLCILLGMPPAELSKILGPGPIPVATPGVVLGIPADLLRRRPDVRRAERLAAAQAEQIGIATADLYPAFSITGTFGYTASNFPDLFRTEAFNGSVGPSFRWNILNYGRIVNNVRYQDARYCELVVAYQNTVLIANKEVEDGLVSFLRSQRRSRLLNESVASSRRARKIVVTQYESGAVDFNRYAVIEQNLVVQQDSAAQARGEISQGLISVFRALGGGWEIRYSGTADAVGQVVPVRLPEAEETPQVDANLSPDAPLAPTPEPLSPSKPAPTRVKKPSAKKR